jgi:hypothetical protein
MTEDAVKAERDRCERIVQAARTGCIDGDFRCIAAWIRSGDLMLYNEKTHQYECDEDRADREKSE